MKRLLVLGLVAVLIIGLAVPAFAGGRRHGHTTANIALGLAAFAVFNQLMAPAYARPRDVVEYVYVAPQPQVLYIPQPQVVVVPPPTPSVVYYPHGRYELRWYGTYYQWIWIPNW